MTGPSTVEVALGSLDRTVRTTAAPDVSLLIKQQSASAEAFPAGNHTFSSCLCFSCWLNLYTPTVFAINSLIFLS